MDVLKELEGYALRAKRLNSQKAAAEIKSAEWLATKKVVEGELTNVSMRDWSPMPGHTTRNHKVLRFGLCDPLPAQKRAQFPNGDSRNLPGNAPKA